MKINILILFAFLLVSSFSSKTEDTKSKMTDTNKIEKKSGQLRHVVLFKFKEGTTPDDIKKVESAFVALPSKIAEIKDFGKALKIVSDNLNKWQAVNHEEYYKKFEELERLFQAKQPYRL